MTCRWSTPHGSDKEQPFEFSRVPRLLRDAILRPGNLGMMFKALVGIKQNVVKVATRQPMWFLSSRTENKTTISVLWTLVKMAVERALVTLNLIQNVWTHKIHKKYVLPVGNLLRRHISKCEELVHEA